MLISPGRLTAHARMGTPEVCARQRYWNAHPVLVQKMLRVKIKLDPTNASVLKDMQVPTN